MFRKIVRSDSLRSSELTIRLSVLLLLPVLYYLGAKFAVSFTVMPEGTAILWPPNGVLLAALILLGGRDYVPLALLAITAEIAADLPAFTWYEALCFGLSNLTEVTIAFILLTRWRFDWRFATLSDLLKFVIAGLLIASLAGAFLGATIYSYFRYSETNYFELLRILWLGDALGLMIFTPLFLSLYPRLGQTHPKLSLRPSDLLMAGVGMVVLALFISTHNGQIWGVHIGPTLLLPFVIFIAVRLGFRWAAIATTAAALIIMVMMVNGQNPFGPLPSREAVIRGQEFIFTMSLLALGASALLFQLHTKQGDLETANQSLNELIQTLESRVVERTVELKQLNVELERLTRIDFLTNIFNRRAFMDCTRLEMARCQRHHSPLALIMFDIDHFKGINDRYGHQTGDRVLQSVSATAGQCIRAVDTLARYGGEEFIILMPATDLASATVVANRIRLTLQSSSISTEQGIVLITASFGVTVFWGSQETLEQVLKRADLALYSAKDSGRNCVVTLNGDASLITR